MEVSHVKVGSNNSGAQGLCKVLRFSDWKFLVTGVLSLYLGKTDNFSVVLSSVGFHIFNGHTELVVTTAKQPLQDML